ncbi:MAG: hypothetical protein AAF479_11775 [Pseudomonadota bacterium]
MPNNMSNRPDPSDRNVQLMANIAEVTPEALAESIANAPELEEGDIDVTDTDAPHEKCAGFGFKFFNVPFAGTLCAGLNESGVAYTIKFTIFGITLVDTHGEWTKSHESTSFTTDIRFAKGTLTIGVNDWTSHYCPFAKWHGQLRLGGFTKDINWGKQLFCLR